MHVEPVVEPDELATLHASVLAPSFPPDELETAAGMAEALRRGTLVAAVARGDDGTALGLATGSWSAGTGVLLLSYLAAAPGVRGGGVGGALLGAALAAWVGRLDPLVVLAEVEDPAAVTGDRPVDHGDPAARLRFYQRRGARSLPVPYVQPALHPGGRRVPGMLLLALAVRADLVDDDGAWRLPAAPLRDFLTGYYAQTEGGSPPPELLRPLDRTEVVLPL
ncbi:hypothetical protein [Cellulomonas massiliensis]|uniref:hypothetical protein n=1 Tax=Cellulomonas massiliensis TaxID=1465811 RepID=UPI00031C3AA3|nr:hypothetical protein [Cellulomonas massiliensis]